MSAPEITDATRLMLAGMLAALDDAEGRVQDLMRPYDATIDRIRGVRDMLLEHHGGLSVAGKCESCDKMLFEGEPGYRCDDVILCADDAPTWGDWRSQLRAGCPDNMDPAEYGEACATVERYFADGTASADVKLPMVPL